MPRDYGEQVEILEPGAKAWTSFVYGTVVDDARFRAADGSNRTGTYELRSKLFKGNNPDVSSNWSPVAKVTVS